MSKNFSIFKFAMPSFLRINPKFVKNLFPPDPNILLDIDFANTNTSIPDNPTFFRSSRFKFNKMPNMKSFFKKYGFFIVLGCVVLLLLLVIVTHTSRTSTGASRTSVLGKTADDRIKLKSPRSTEDINREFKFSLLDNNGKELGKFSYFIQNAELRDEIILKGVRTPTIVGRTFLIINLKFTNPLNNDIQINAKDYIRLTVNNLNEKLAPEIHNDPVDVQAISTKYTRVGFIINDTDKNLVLQIGEIKGDKQSIPLNLQ